MPQITDRTTLRTILETDRSWAAYALADLEPGFFEHTTWFSAVGETSALAMVYTAFATPVLFTLGPVPELRTSLDEMERTLNPPELYVVVRPEVVPLPTERYHLAHERVMQRMILVPPQHHARSHDAGVRLGPTDLEAVQSLYGDGEASGEAPDWFLPEMLAQGVYYGIRDAGELVAIAGTHIVTPREGIGCLGNIYTRRDRRGRGLSTQVTDAVCAQLISMKLQTIGLNVRENNGPAIRVYKQLGFRRYCCYVEALARK